MTTRLRQVLAVAMVAVAAAGAGFALWYSGQQREQGGNAGNVLAGTTIRDLAGVPQPLDQWRGKVLVVNFWATWCAPCRQEIPEFIRAQDRYGAQGLQLVGIAIDQKDKVAAFAQEMRFNYPILIGEVDAMELSRKLGNRSGGLPFTVVFDRDGRLASIELGLLNEAKVSSLIQHLM